jgi:hypothetical protein
MVGLPLVRTTRVGWFKIALALTGIQWLLAIMILDSEVLRVLSGVVLGATAAPIIREGFEELFTKTRTAHESM